MPLLPKNQYSDADPDLFDNDKNEMSSSNIHQQHEYQPQYPPQYQHNNIPLNNANAPPPHDQYHHQHNDQHKDQQQYPPSQSTQLPQFQLQSPPPMLNENLNQHPDVILKEHTFLKDFKPIVPLILSILVYPTIVHFCINQTKKAIWYTVMTIIVYSLSFFLCYFIGAFAMFLIFVFNIFFIIDGYVLSKKLWVEGKIFQGECAYRLMTLGLSLIGLNAFVTGDERDPRRSIVQS